MVSRTNRNIKLGLVAAGLIGAVHWFLHASVYGTEWMPVGYWIVAVAFVYLVFVQDKIFK